MSELPKYECHLCLEAGRKNWKQRCPWALKLAEILIYHRNLNVALDLKLAEWELLQKNIPGLAVSLKATGCVWWPLAVLRLPGEIRTWQLQIQHNQTIKCYILPSDFSLPTNILPVRISFSHNLCSDTSGPQESLDLRDFMQVAKSEWMLFPRLLCKSLCAGDANPPSQSRTSCLHGNLPTTICCTERYFR